MDKGKHHTFSSCDALTRSDSCTHAIVTVIIAYCLKISPLWEKKMSLSHLRESGLIRNGVKPDFLEESGWPEEVSLLPRNDGLFSHVDIGKFSSFQETV